MARQRTARLAATLAALAAVISGPAVSAAPPKRVAQNPDNVAPGVSGIAPGEQPKEGPTTQVVDSSPFLSTPSFDAALADPPADAAPATDPNAPAAWSFDQFNPYVQRFGLGYTGGDGVGYNGGYGTFEWMTPIHGDNDFDILFGEAHVNLLNDATVSSNLGIVYRWYDLPRNRIWGLNGFWDYRDSGHNGFNQLGAGIESLGPLMDFRANAYVPDVDQTVGVLPGFFVGNRLLINREVAMTGFDAEAGLSVINEDRLQFKVFGGGYFFAGHKGAPDATGWRVRAEADLDQQYNLDVRVQDDDVFGMTASVGVTIRFLHRFLPPAKQTPVPMDHKFFRRYGDAEAGTISSRLSEPVARQTNVVLNRISDIARDPTTGLAYNFLHVVNGGAGTGTFENPYGTLTTALADVNAGTSIIYTPQGGTFNENIVLVPGATVLGNGVAQFLPTQYGAEQLPFSPGTPSPSLTGNVTMANDSRFSGFNVTGRLLANGVSNIEVDNATFSSIGDAITLNGVNGAAITNVTVTAAGGGNGATITDSDADFMNFKVATGSANGVVINNGANDRTITFTDLNVQSAGTQGLDVNVTGAGDLTLTLQGSGTTGGGNTISSTGNAVDILKSGAGNAIVSLNDTTVASTTGSGIVMDGSAGAGTLYVTAFNGNTVSRAIAGGFRANVVTFDADPTTAAIDAVAGSLTVGSSTTLTNVVGDGVRLLNTTGALQFSTLDIFNSTGTGLLVDTTGLGTTFSISSESTSTISTTAGAAMQLNTVTVDLAFDSIRSVNSPTRGIFLNTVAGNIDSGTTTINAASPPSIQIQNTVLPLTVDLGTTSIASTVSTLFGDNIDILTGNGGNLELLFNSLSITGP